MLAASRTDLMKKRQGSPCSQGWSVRVSSPPFFGASYIPTDRDYRSSIVPSGKCLAFLARVLE